MARLTRLLAAALAASTAFATSAGDPSVIADFTAPHPAVAMDTVNDPVMGGRSFSTATVKDGGLVWEGEVKIVPSLQAPGFCILETKPVTAGSLPLTMGADLCYLVDGANSGTLLEPMSVSVTAMRKRDATGNNLRGPAPKWGHKIAPSGKRHFHGNMGTSYSAVLKVKEEKRADNLKEYCATLNADSFKSQWHGQTDTKSVPMDKDALAKVTQIRLSTYSSKKAGAFKMKLNKLYVTANKEDAAPVSTLE